MVQVARTFEEYTCQLEVPSAMLQKLELEISILPVYSTVPLHLGFTDRILLPNIYNKSYIE